MTTFVSVEAPELKLSLDLSDGSIANIKFEEKHLVLDDEKDKLIIAALKKAIDTRPNISRLVKEVNRDAALAAVAEHRQQLAQQASTTKGPTTGTDATRAQIIQKAQQDQITMLQQGTSKEKIEEVISQLEKDHGLVIPRVGDPSISADSTGFKPNADQNTGGENTDKPNTEPPPQGQQNTPTPTKPKAGIFGK